MELNLELQLAALSLYPDLYLDPLLLAMKLEWLPLASPRSGSVYGAIERIGAGYYAFTSLAATTSVLRTGSVQTTYLNNSQKERVSILNCLYICWHIERCKVNLNRRYNLYIAQGCAAGETI